MSTNRVVIPAAVLVLTAALAGCVPEPAASPAAESVVPTTSASAAPSASPSPTPTVADIALPDDCRDIYSSTMLGSLEQAVPPLNDPGVSMLSTQNAALLEQLEVLPTIRCSWGVPSDTGLATNVSIVDADTAATIANELAAADYGCGEEAGATVCRSEQRGISLDDVEYSRGETHALRGNLWVSTAWLNVSPDGYTQDILTTLGA